MWREPGAPEPADLFGLRHGVRPVSVGTFGTWGAPSTRRSGRSDRALVERLRAGDEQTFAALVDGWSGWMLRLARAHVPTTSAAEEVVQETWLAVLEGLDRFRGDAALRTWVYRILLNQAKRRGVRESRTVPFASLAPEDQGPTVDPHRFQGPEEQYPGGWRQFPEEWPEQVVLTREVREVVTEALTELPPRQRIVVALRDLDGHTPTRFATCWKSPPVTSVCSCTADEPSSGPISRPTSRPCLRLGERCPMTCEEFVGW